MFSLSNAVSATQKDNESDADGRTSCLTTVRRALRRRPKSDDGKARLAVAQQGRLRDDVDDDLKTWKTLKEEPKKLREKLKN
ncbi:F-box protein SKIP1-like [Iris pallida]|uniref:F-box protein SKIP1-like n=1 Tax=Iris pallida TaxID=29817 RepID=A0AAX6EY89_IRIPA|nr:F-box protein SKIP1-like [Iris pallida]